MRSATAAPVQAPRRTMTAVPEELPPAEALPPAVDAIDYAERWRLIVERRRVQMEAAYEASGLQNVDYWGRRAKNYREALHIKTEQDPLFVRVLHDVTSATTMLDVGAGTGRHTLAFAPHVAAVTAVDPSAAMLGLLQEDLAAQKLTNVTVVQSDWLQADVTPADVVLCSHVLYPIADVVPFIRKLDASARERVYVYLRIDPLPTDFGLWQEFWGEPLTLQPTAYDLFGVLTQLNIAPDFEVVEHRFTWTFASIDEAVPQVRNSLCLREDDEAAAAKVRALLSERMVAWPEGRIGPAVGSARSAIVSWRPAL